MMNYLEPGTVGERVGVWTIIHIMGTRCECTAQQRKQFVMVRRDDGLEKLVTLKQFRNDTIKTRGK